MEYLIIGLGNPGKEYEGTRHNVGQDVVEVFRLLHDFPEWEFSKNANALYSHGKIGKSEVELLLPQTFMNNSGKAVKYAQTKHKLKPENIVIVHDDIDLPLGELKIIFARGTGGHNGVKSIVKYLGTKDFTRLRFGITPTDTNGKIKKPTTRQATVNFVLKKFSIFRERGIVKNTISRASEALTTIIERGRTKAMNDFN